MPLPFHREKQLSSNVITHIKGNSLSIHKVFLPKIKCTVLKLMKFFFIKSGLFFCNSSHHLVEGMSWRTEERPFLMTSHMIQLTDKALHLHPRRRYLNSSVCITFLLYCSVQQWLGLWFCLSFNYLYLILLTNFICLDFPWLGLWCPESCIWGFQCLCVCLWPNRLRKILHHDGSYSKAFFPHFPSTFTNV